MLLMDLMNKLECKWTVSPVINRAADLSMILWLVCCSLVPVTFQALGQLILILFLLLDFDYMVFLKMIMISKLSVNYRVYLDLALYWYVFSPSFKFHYVVSSSHVFKTQFSLQLASITHCGWNSVPYSISMTFSTSLVINFFIAVMYCV